MRQEKLEDLRRKAEEQLTEREGRIKILERADLETLAYELAVHQVELEIQNEELRRTRLEAEAARDRYLDLFEFAPVGYFSLDEHNRIVEANQAGCQLLKTNRRNILNKSFTKFLQSEDSEKFHLQRRKVLESGLRETFELRMQKADGALFYAQVISLKVKEERLRLALIDITERKKAEEALARAKDELEIKVKERTRELAKANGELKQYANRITQVQEEERKRIAYELHDDTAQYLGILKMQLNALLHSGEIQSPKAKDKIQFLEKDADRAFNDVRRYSHELRPVVLENQGLLAAIEQIADDYNKLGQLSINVNVEGAEPELSEEVKLGYFRIAQEALNNVRKHSQASQVAINLNFQDTRMEMSVSDNGSGFDVKAARNRANGQSSLGLLSMQERAKLIGADLKIESKPGNGTRVIVEVKL